MYLSFLSSEFFIQPLFFLHSSVLFLVFWWFFFLFFYLQVFLAELRSAAALFGFISSPCSPSPTLHFQSLRVSIHGAHSAFKAHLGPSGSLLPAERSRPGLPRVGQPQPQPQPADPGGSCRERPGSPVLRGAGFLRSHTHPQLPICREIISPCNTNEQHSKLSKGVLGLSWCLAQPSLRPQSQSCWGQAGLALSPVLWHCHPRCPGRAQPQPQRLKGRSGVMSSLPPGAHVWQEGQTLNHLVSQDH